MLTRAPGGSRNGWPGTSAVYACVPDVATRVPLAVRCR